MDIMQNLSNWLGGGVDGVSNMFEKRFPGRQERAPSPTPAPSGRPGWGQNQPEMTGQAGGGGLGGLGGLLGPSVLGGLAGVLMGGRNRAGGARPGGFGGMGGMGGGLGNMITGALIAGGKMLWDKYKDRIRQENQDKKPDYGTAAPPQEQALRMIRALVYAAKADGHIDDQEQAAINEQVRQMNIGESGQRIIQQVMAEPLDPNLVAQGVKNEDEALQLFTVSCAVINIDNFMESAYLDGLAKALGIPDDVKRDLEAKLKTPAATATM